MAHATDVPLKIQEREEMKLFGEFEAVRFPEENLLLVTKREYLYYIYSYKYKSWRKYRRAGNDCITVCNYEDPSREEIQSTMGGVFPKRETDFMRLCCPDQLHIGNMLTLLSEDYPMYMSAGDVLFSVEMLLEESVIVDKSYMRLKALFDSSLASCLSSEQVLIGIKELCADILGRDVFKKEIGIVDGHDSSSYFWIMPARIVDYEDTDGIDNVAEMRSNEISIEEDDVNQYLTPFLYKYFDEELEANKKRWDADGFEWYLTHNYFTMDSVRRIINDIRDTAEALAVGRENEYTAKLREKRGMATYQLIYSKDLSEEQIKAYNDNRPTEDDTDKELIIDFYRRFIYRMEYMVNIGEEKGYNLISFMGP